MARRVFFSFHFDRDVRRIQQVRQSWVLRPGGEAQPFYDAAEFERVKARAGGIENWIEEQLKGTSVTVVLFGAETYKRKWVIYEIERSHKLRKGLLAVDIHRVKDPQTGSDVQGKNPLATNYVHHNGSVRSYSDLYKSYDWVLNDGYKNLPAWIERAASDAGR